MRRLDTEDIQLLLFWGKKPLQMGHLNLKPILLKIS